MIRFNSKGEFNVPFCRKANRFSKSYITKIVNQVEKIIQILDTHGENWNFECCDWSEALNKTASENRLVYLDPPYVDRHDMYFDSWGNGKNKELYKSLLAGNYRFILSNWLENSWRKNESLNVFLESEKFQIFTQKHTYFVGAKEANRNSITECLIINF